MTTILAIETSCDETAAAVIEDGQRIRSNVVASQIDLHRRYGGIFPEVASRQHILTIDTVIQDALQQADADWANLDAIAVTNGPGLAGSLLVGVNTAKAIALAQNLPLIAVNHLEGHLYSNWLQTGEYLPTIEFPVLSLIVSGGHTELVLVEGHGQYRILGRTIDDAAGEAFDKIARLLGIGYPGGPAVQKTAQGGNPHTFNLPVAKTRRPYDFSFSGLKTAVLRVVQKYSRKLEKPSDTATQQLDLFGLPTANLAASAQSAIVRALVKKTLAATQAFPVKGVFLAGGVSANTLLRQEMAAQLPVPVYSPPLYLCTDNAAMIGAVAYWQFQRREFSGGTLDVYPNLKLKTIPPTASPDKA